MKFFRDPPVARPFQIAAAAAREEFKAQFLREGMPNGHTSARDREYYRIGTTATLQLLREQLPCLGTIREI